MEISRRGLEIAVTAALVVRFLMMPIPASMSTLPAYYGVDINEVDQPSLDDDF